MNTQDILPGLKVWFGDYIGQFSSDDPTVQESMDMKAEHTWRVCHAVLDIGGTLHLSKEELCLAEVAGLLHDIGDTGPFSISGRRIMQRSG